MTLSPRWRSRGQQTARVVRVALLSSLVMTGCAGTSATSKDVQPPPGLSGAAAPKDPQSQYELARSYCCGTEAETRQALHWYCSAAMQGHSEAQLAMAHIFANRVGGDVRIEPTLMDLRSAYMWYTVAAANGIDRAFDERIELEARMTPAQVGEAKRWATRWKQASCESAGL